MSGISLHVRWWLVCGWIVSIGLASSAVGQSFTTVYNVPPDDVPYDIGSDTQLNLLEGGTISHHIYLGADSVPNSNIEMNFLGGTLGSTLYCYEGSTVNFYGGNMNGWFVVDQSSTLNILGGQVTNPLRVFASGVVNVNGGFVNGLTFNAYADTIVNHNGGVIGDDFNVHYGSTFNATGGRIGRWFRVFSTGSATFYGDDFKMDGVPIEGLNQPGDSVLLPSLGVLTGTLTDGTTFAISSLAGDGIDPNVVKLQIAPVPAAVPGMIYAPTDPVPNGLRAGQTLNLGPLATVPDHYATTGGAMNVDGGSVGDDLEIADSAVTLLAGDIGDYVKVYHNGMLNIDGGSVECKATSTMAGP